MQPCETCYLRTIAAPVLMIVAVVFAIATLLIIATNGPDAHFTFLACVACLIVATLTWSWTLPPPKEPATEA